MRMWSVVGPCEGGANDSPPLNIAGNVTLELPEPGPHSGFWSTADHWPPSETTWTDRPGRVRGVPQSPPGRLLASGAIPDVLFDRDPAEARTCSQVVLGSRLPPRNTSKTKTLSVKVPGRPAHVKKNSPEVPIQAGPGSGFQPSSVSNYQDSGRSSETVAVNRCRLASTNSRTADPSTVL